VLPDSIFSNANLGKFWSVLQQNMLVNFVAITSIQLTFGIFGIFTAVWYILLSFWYIFPVLVCGNQENSGNPGPEVCIATFVSETYEGLRKKQDTNVPSLKEAGKEILLFCYKFFHAGNPIVRKNC
jgi:hypothetical protein